MRQTVGWGILATGWIAEQFVKDLKLHGHRVVAVGSRDQASADHFANRYGIARAHGSYEALASDPEVDVVYVATPHPMHAENAKLALSHGKHVLVEKPFTINACEAAEVIALAAEKRLVVLEAMWTRFLPHMVRLREVIASGILGEIRSLMADHTQDLPEDPAHRLNAPELGGGALLDLGIYPISLTFDLLGKPLLIKSSATFKPTGVDATVATLFEYASGAIAITLSSSDTAGRNIATILGTAGRIEIDPVWYLPASFSVFDNAGTRLETYRSDVQGRGMQYQAAEMERLINSGETAGTILPPAQTVEIMRTLDTIRQQIGLRYPSEA